MLSTKAAELVPVKAVLLITSAAVPVLLSVTVWTALAAPTSTVPNARLVELRLTTGAETPVPLRLTLCGLPAALSATVSLALIAPAAVGAKVTEIVQLALALRLLPHVVVVPKSRGLVPVVVMLLIFRVAFPLLVSVTVFAALVVFTVSLPKAMVSGLKDTPGFEVPLPELH